MSFQSRGNASSKLSIEGLELSLVFLALWTEVLEGNNRGIGMVGGKAGLDGMLKISGTSSTTTRAGSIGTLVDSGSASLTLFEVDEEVFPFCFF